MKDKKTHNQQHFRRNLYGLSVLGAVLGVGILLWLFFQPHWPSVLSPGPIHQAHRTIADCADCHAGSTHSPLAALVNFVQNKPQKSNNTERCLHCHKRGESPRNPHGLSTARLAVLAKQAGDGEKKVSPQSAITCGLCHREHHGKKKALTDLPEPWCQSCHQQQFNNFVQGHPAFSVDHGTEKTTLLFDHVRHYQQYFLEPKFQKKAPKQCQSCHGMQAEQRSRSYETTCQACHQNDIVSAPGATNKGIPFFTVPGLDVITLQKHPNPLGVWPVQADAELTPFMLFMLSFNPAFSSIATSLKTIDLVDLRGATQAQLKAVEQLVWQIKMLLADFASEGTQSVYRVIKSDKHSPLPQLMSEASLDAFIQAAFPGLAQEVKQRRAGYPVPTRFIPGEPPSSHKENTGESWAEHGGWYSEDHTLYYRPRQHRDRVITAWLDFSGRIATKPTQDFFNVLADKEAVGACGKCHRVTRDAQGRSQIHWRATHEKSAAKATHFSHTPHIPLMNEKGCQQCHRLSGKPYDFTPIKKQYCSTCHTPDKAGSACVTCHRYHLSSPDIDH